MRTKLIKKKKIANYFLLFLVFLSFIAILNSNVIISNPSFKQEESQIRNLNTSLIYEWNRTAELTEVDRGEAYCQDAEGNHYVVGYNGTGQELDILLQKFNNSGDLEWIRSWNGEYDDTDSGKDVVVDSFGNIYVLGTVENRGTSTQDIIVIKYNSDGVYQWNSTWFDPSYSCIAYGMVIDENNSIYTLVRVSASPDYTVLIKFDNTTGAEVWNVSYQLSQYVYPFGKAISLDSNNNIVIAASNWTNPDWDIQLIKYAPNGTQLWNRTVDHFLRDYVSGLCIDNDDNIYLCGYDSINIPSLGFLVKCFPNGTMLNNATVLNSGQINGIDLDQSTGDLYVTGYSKVSTYESDILLACYDNDLNPLWNTTRGNGNDDQDSGRDIYFDDNGYVYIVGYWVQTFDDSILLKLSLAPDNFTLGETALDPDQDGKFFIGWEKIIGADNYTVYNSTTFIDELNGSQTIENNGNQIDEKFINITSLSDGHYFYKVKAHGKYGNSTSDCIHIKVVRKPLPFTIDCNTTEVDDGIFKLNWTESSYAENYTIGYQAGNTIGNLLTCEKYQNVTSSIRSLEINISSEPNGNYTFKVWAFNTFDGNNTSIASDNTITISLGIPPGINNPIIISSPNAGNPDTDKEFRLTYGISGDNADRYELYYSSDQPVGIQSSSLKTSALYGMELLYNDTSGIGQYFVTEANALPDGLIYFVVVGYNDYGNYTSEIFTLTLGFPSSDDGIPWWIYPIITGIISACVGIVIKQTYSSVKKRRIFMQNVQDKFEQVDNIEAFLKEKLDYEEWQRLQGHVDKYQKHQISNKDLIKAGKKEVGKDFTDLFLGKKKPKE